MASLKEPLVTLGLIVAILLFHLKPGQFRFLLPSLSEASHRTCTSMRGVEINQWPLFLFHHANKGHLAFDMLSFLWKGTLLEGCIGSRQFAAMVFTLLFACGGLLIMTGAVLQILGVADLYPSMCQVCLPGLHFALSFILSSKHERYRFIIPIHYQNLYRVIIPANYAVELALVYFSCPGLLFSSPFCGTLAGFLYSHGPQLRSSFNSWLHLNRRWLCPLTKISRTSEQEQFMETTGLIWRCHACTYDNSITTDPFSCAICEALRFQFIGSTEMQENPDSVGLVWSCPACTLDNGVFLHECEICGTPRPVFG